MNTRNFGSDHSHDEEPPAEERWQSLSVAGEDEYLVETRRIGLGRMVGVILLMHVIAVGGVMAFRYIGSNNEDSATASTSSVVSEETSSSSKENKRQRIYYVRAGDDLPSIARLYDASVAQLKSVNKLSSGDKLTVGQRLIIPDDPHQSSGTEQVNVASTPPLEPRLIPGQPTEDNQPETKEEPTISEEPLIAKVYDEPEMQDPVKTAPIFDPPTEKQEPIRATPIVIDDDEPEPQPEPQVTIAENSSSPPSSMSSDSETESAPVLTPVPQPQPQYDPAPAPRPELPMREEEERKPVIAQVIPMDQLPEDDGPISRPSESDRRLPTIGSNPALTRIPKAIPYNPKRDPQPTSRNSAVVRTYTVQSGDTFYGIARKFGVTVDELMRFNGLQDPRQLRAGSVIRIP